MENLNAEQVKKALEWAISEEFCENCLCTVYGKSMTIFLNEVLAIINSQEQRVGELAEENERLRAEKETLEIYNADYKFKNKEVMAFNRRWAKECADLQEECDLIKEKTEENIKLRLAMHFGTYTDKDTVKIADVFKLIDQIAKEMLEGENEN